MKSKTKLKIWMLAILIVPFFMVSCEDEPDPVEVNEAEVLITWLESTDSPAGKYYVNTDMGEYTTASALNTLMGADKAYVIDIRSAGDFALGHIYDAVNIAADAVADHIDATDLSAYDEIVLACASGQTAAWLTCLLNLEGYTNVSSLKFGMCAWADAFADPWNNALSSEKSTFFEAEVTDKAAEGDLPVLTTGYETAEEIFDARMDAVLTEGFGAAAITSAVVYGDLDNYYIINYWPNAEYLDPGHIEGATQYTPKEDIALDVDLKTLPTDKTIVVYCYTGQGSANLTAYLRLVGYDAKSLKYGTNGMIYDDMTKSKWNAGMIMNFDYWTPGK